MQPMNNRAVTLLSNATLMMLCGYSLVDELITYGRINWVDHNAIADGDELYLHQMAAVVLIIGSCILWRYRGTSYNVPATTKIRLLDSVLGLYGLILGVTCIGFFFALLASYVNGQTLSLQLAAFYVTLFVGKTLGYRLVATALTPYETIAWNYEQCKPMNHN